MAMNDVQKKIFSSFGRTWLNNDDDIFDDEPPSKPLVVFFGGARDSKHKNMKRVFDNYQNPSHQKAYFQWNQTLFAILLVKFWHSEVKQPICLIGHSYGGDSARDVAKDCDSSASIRLLVTLDPVSSSAYVGTQHSKPVNVANWINVWVYIPTITTPLNPIPVPATDESDNVIAWLGGHWGRQDSADKDIAMGLSATHAQAGLMYKEAETEIRKFHQ